MKKAIIVMSIVFVSIITMAICFLVKTALNPVLASLPGWERSDCYYSDGFQDYVNYCKYYYSKDITSKLDKNIYFKPATDKDVKEIKSYFNNFKKWVEFEEYKDKYDFKESCVDTSDYFYIENKDTCEKYKGYPSKYAAYNVYFFDAQTKTLFFIHSNI